MKKMIPMALAGVTMLLCGAVYADDMAAGKPEKAPMTMEEKMAKKQADHLDMMTKKLALTPDQTDKVGAILKANGEQKKAMMMKMEADEKTMKEAQDTQIKAILTPEQSAMYDKMMAEHKAKMDKKKGEKHEMGGMEKK